MSVKKEIRVSKFLDWIDVLVGKSRSEAIEWLKNSIPTDAYLDVQCDYDNTYGVVYTLRLETDEEEAEREVKEAQIVKERKARERAAQESQAEKMERYAFEEVALHAYLKQHEGNPRIGDLDNLFRALQGLERDGKAETSIQQIKDCMRRLENG